MSLNIAEIGGKRLEKVLIKDKKENPTKMCDLLKSDLRFLFENYMEINNLDLNFEIVDSRYQIQVKVQAKRLKSFGSLPYWRVT